MVYGAINEKGERYYTQMGRVFDAINNRQMEYNWFITDIADGAPPKIWERYNDDNYCWITGEQLSEIVREQDIQWVWAVLSGFYIRDMSIRGYENCSKYEVGDYEEDCIEFYCPDIVIKHLEKV